MVDPSLGPGNNINALGAIAFLITLWFIAMAQDIYTTRVKRKDLDDVVLYLLIGILIQLILFAILPTKGVIPILNDNFDLVTNPLGGGTTTNWGFWYLPDITWADLRFMGQALVPLRLDRPHSLRDHPYDFGLEGN